MKWEWLRKLGGNKKLKRDPRKNLRDNIFFIHVPKTGGTSIAQSLGLKGFSHVKAKEIFAAGKKNLLRKNFSFGVVRNPYERFISLYNYARMEKSYYHNNLAEPEDKSFPYHLDYHLLKNASLRECAVFLKENRLRNDLEWNQWEPQYTWLYDQKGKKCLVEKIYTLENLENLKIDLRKQGIEISDFPKLNESCTRNLEIELDDFSRDIIKEIYREDFLLFNYKF